MCLIYYLEVFVDGKHLEISAETKDLDLKSAPIPTAVLF